MRDRFVETKATRNYDIFYANISRCDLCKLFKESFELIPLNSMHNFDNIFLCRDCITKCGFEIREGVLNEIDEQRRNNEGGKTINYNTE